MDLKDNGWPIVEWSNPAYVNKWARGTFDGQAKCMQSGTDSEGKKCLGKRWEYNIKMDLKDNGWPIVEWSNPAYVNKWGTWHVWGTNEMYAEWY